MSIFKRKESKKITTTVGFYEESKRQLVDTVNRLLKAADTDISALLDLDEQSGRMLGIACEYVKSSDLLMKQAAEESDRKEEAWNRKFDDLNKQLLKNNELLQRVLSNTQK